MKLKIPNDAKMKELILHVAKASEKDEKFGAAKLNKILFYADFLSYLKRGHSITGQEYFALDEGPAPQRLLPIREAMLDKDEIAIQKTNYFGFPQERVVALRSPNYDRLEAEDIATVGFVLSRLRDMNGTEVSNLSHQFIGWQMAFKKGRKTVIPYSVARFHVQAFLGIDPPELPPSLVQHAKALHRRLVPPQSRAAA